MLHIPFSNFWNCFLCDRHTHLYGICIGAKLRPLVAMKNIISQVAMKNSEQINYNNSY